MNQFKIYANRTVKFATRIPGFMNLHHVHDQVQLIRSSIHCVVLLCLQNSKTSSQWNYFNIIEQKFYDQCQQMFPFIEFIRLDVDKIQLYLERLNLDEKEFSLLLSLIIVSTGKKPTERRESLKFDVENRCFVLANIRLDDFLLIDSAQTDLTCALCDYMDRKRGAKSRDFYTLMFLFPSLRKLNVVIQNCISNEVPKHLEYPAFFSRVYLNEQDCHDLNAMINQTYP